MLAKSTRRSGVSLRTHAQHDTRTHTLTHTPRASGEAERTGNRYAIKWSPAFFCKFLFFARPD